MPSPGINIISLILTVRGQRVILDRDLASLYGVPTFRFNEAVKRNRSRFPQDFMFQLTAEEFAALKSQIAMSNPSRGGRRTLPYAFTEHGAVMAANILKSPKAIQISVFVVRAFIRMRQMLNSQQDFARKLVDLEKKLAGRLDVHETTITELLQQIVRWLNPPRKQESPKKRIGFLAEARASYTSKSSLDDHLPGKTKKKDKLKIRDARRSDREAALEVTLEAFGQYAAVMPPSRWAAYRENIIETLAEVEPAEQIVAEQDGEIVGAVLMYPPGTAFPTPEEGPLTCPEVRLLAVDPKARGQGIGKALMRECIRRARRLGAGCLNLHTTDMMKVAMHMYERMGFVRDPERDFHPDPKITVKAYRFELHRAARAQGGK